MYKNKKSTSNSKNPPWHRTKKWVSYAKAKQWAIEQQITSSTEWYRASSIRPKNIPANPYKIYKEWKNWTDFLTDDKEPKTKEET